MRAHHDRAAVGDEALKHRADRHRRDRIDRLQRLVEHEHPGTVQHRRRKPNLLGHPGRIVGDQRPLGVGEAEHAQQLVAARAHQLGLEPTQQPQIRQQLTSGQTSRQRQPGRQHPEQPLGLGAGGPVPDRMTEHERVARIGCQQPNRRRQQRRLAGTVRADQPVKGSPWHLQVDPVDRDRRPERLAQSVERQSRRPSRHGATTLSKIALSSTA